MTVISGGNIIEGLGVGSPLTAAGAPSNGTNAVFTLTGTGTISGGTFRLKFQGHWTAPIAYSAAASAVAAALNALHSVGTGGFTGGGGALPNTPVTLTAGANLAKHAIALSDLVVDGAKLTGSAPVLTATLSTPGVTATARGAATGAQLIDTTAGVLYQNSGTPLAPVWTKVSAQGGGGSMGGSGTAGTLAKFTTDGTTLGDSIASESAGVLTVAGDEIATGLLKAGSGPTTLTDAVGKVLSASLNTVGVAQGGSGLATRTAHAVQVGAGTSPVTQIGVGATGTVLVGATAGDPSFSASPTVTSLTGRIIHAADVVGSNTVAGSGALTLTAGKAFFPVASTGGAVTGVTLPDGTTAGQEIFLVGTSDTLTVSLPVNGSTKIAAANGVTARVLANKDVLHLIWDGASWLELSFSNNL